MMNFKHFVTQKTSQNPLEMMGLVGASALLGLPLLAQPGWAETESFLKQSPPYNAPGMTEPGRDPSPPYEAPEINLPVEDPQLAPSQPPLPSERSEPVANISPRGERASIRLINNTDVDVHYELVGYTDQRVIPGGESVTLRNVMLPVTVATWREDAGFIELLPVSAERPSLLEIGLDEDSAPLDSNQGVLRIQQDGQVFLN